MINNCMILFTSAIKSLPTPINKYDFKKYTFQTLDRKLKVSIATEMFLPCWQTSSIFVFLLRMEQSKNKDPSICGRAVLDGKHNSKHSELPLQNVYWDFFKILLSFLRIRVTDFEMHINILSKVTNSYLAHLHVCDRFVIVFFSPSRPIMFMIHFRHHFFSK